MNEKIVLAGLMLLCAVLLFGCTGGAGQSGGTQAQGGVGGATQATQGAVQGAAATATPAQGGASGGSGKEWVGKGYAELLNLGVPVQCTVKMSGQGYSGESKMFFSGGKARIESKTLVEGQSFDSVSVVKNKKVYLKLNSLMQVGPYANCDWLAAEEEKPQQTQGQPSTADYEKIPPVDFQCGAWVPDETLFLTPGKVCEPEVIGSWTASNVPTMPPGLESCSGLEGQALMQCIQSNQG
ncbi:MAG: hypothetical protein QW343_04440 [Candidatus Norongarragalinales archaeon]